MNTYTLKVLGESNEILGKVLGGIHSFLLEGSLSMRV